MLILHVASRVALATLFHGITTREHQAAMDGPAKCLKVQTAVFSSACAICILVIKEIAP